MKKEKDLYYLKFELPEEFYISKDCSQYITKKFKTLKQLDNYTMRFKTLNQLAYSFLYEQIDKRDYMLEGTYVDKKQIFDFYNSRNLDLGKSMKFIRVVSKGKVEIKRCILLNSDKGIKNNGTMISNILGFVHNSDSFDNFNERASIALRTAFIGELVFPSLEKIGITNEEHKKDIRNKIIQCSLKYSLKEKVIEDLLKQYGYKDNLDYVSYVLMSRYNEEKDFMNKANAEYSENYSDYFIKMARLDGGTPKYTVLRRYYEYMRYFRKDFLKRKEKTTDKTNFNKHLLFEMAPDKEEVINNYKNIEDMVKKISKKPVDKIDEMVDEFISKVEQKKLDNIKLDDIKSAPDFVIESETPKILQREIDKKTEIEILKEKKEKYRLIKLKLENPNYEEEQKAMDKSYDDFLKTIGKENPDVKIK